MANPTLLKTPIASGGDKNTIPETTGSTTGLLSQEKGWQQINSLPINAGGIAPSRLDFNGVFNLLSNILFYTQKGWQWEFDETQNYFAGCTVKDTADGKTYVCIADVNASTTHPSSDTTHWKLSDLATKDDLANYLPLAGGQMTGTQINRNVDNSNLIVAGASDTAKGAYLAVNGENNGGKFALTCRKDSQSKWAELVGTPTGNNAGTLTWCGSNVLTDANGGYLPLSGGTITGNLFIDPAYAYLVAGVISRNNSVGDMTVKAGAPNDWNEPMLILRGSGHQEYPSNFQLRASNSQNSKILRGTPDGLLTWDGNDLGGSAIVAKSLGTNGYSKRADGLIEQWGQTTAPATVSDNVPVTFPITFPNAVSSVTITSEGNLTDGNSPMSYTQVIDVTNSGFKYRSFYNSPGEIKKYWRAIGY